MSLVVGASSGVFGHRTIHFMSLISEGLPQLFKILDCHGGTAEGGWRLPQRCGEPCCWAAPSTPKLTTSLSHTT